MSVMQQLKSLAGQEGTSSIPKFSKEGQATEQQLEDTESMMLTESIPGQSLTQDPESRLPYESAPKFTDIQDFIDETFLTFTGEDKLPDLLGAMRSGLPVEYIAEKYLTKAFRKGDITPDLMLLCIEPTIYMLISLATYAEIDPVLYPEDPMIDEQADEINTDLYKKATQDLLKSPDSPKGNDNKLTVADFQAPTNMPSSLLSRSKQAVSKVTRGEVK
jgi:hypothetical protein